MACWNEGGAGWWLWILALDLVSVDEDGAGSRFINILGVVDVSAIECKLACGKRIKRYDIVSCLCVCQTRQSTN